MQDSQHGKIRYEISDSARFTYNGRFLAKSLRVGDLSTRIGERTGILFKGCCAGHQAIRCQHVGGTARKSKIYQSCVTAMHQKSARVLPQKHATHPWVDRQIWGMQTMD